MVGDTVLRKLAELETSLAELYGWYSEIFASDDEVAFVFFKLQGEESSHAGLVEYQRRLVQLSPALSARVDIDMEGIESALKRARALRTVPEAPTVADAVREALLLEMSAAESHYRNALKQANKEMGRLLDALSGEDKGHVVRLLDLAKRRGIPIPAPDVR